MKKNYIATVSVVVFFEADEENLGEHNGQPNTLRDLAMDVVYGRDKKDNDRTDNNGRILDFSEIAFVEDEEQ